MMYGIYINCTRAPFIALILLCLKRNETRTRDVFRAIIGERVALIQSGKNGRPAVVRGYVTIGAPRRVSYDDTRARKAAYILGTPYDIKPGGYKVFYPMINPRRCKPYALPADHVNHGRSYCEFTRPAGK